MDFEIMFNDLKPKAQKRLLEFLGLSSAAEGNYDAFPIAFVPKPLPDVEGK
jgi:hypothetical protein